MKFENPKMELILLAGYDVLTWSVSGGTREENVEKSGNEETLDNVGP